MVDAYFLAMILVGLIIGVGLLWVALAVVQVVGQQWINYLGERRLRRGRGRG